MGFLPGLGSQGQAEAEGPCGGACPCGESEAEAVTMLAVFMKHTNIAFGHVGNIVEHLRRCDMIGV